MPSRLDIHSSVGITPGVVCSYLLCLLYNAVVQWYVHEYLIHYRIWHEQKKKKKPGHYDRLIIFIPERRSPRQSRCIHRLPRDVHRRLRGFAGANSVEGEIQLADQCFHIPNLSQYTMSTLLRRSGLTYRNNRSTSPTIHLVEICSTENAAYPGSAICLILRISLSSASSRFEKLYGRGVFRYGGRG